MNKNQQESLHKCLGTSNVIIHDSGFNQLTFMGWKTIIIENKHNHNFYIALENTSSRIVDGVKMMFKSFNDCKNFIRNNLIDGDSNYSVTYRMYKELFN